MKLILLALLLIFPLRVSAQEYPFYSENTRTAQEWIQSLKDWELKQHWTPPVSTVNNAISNMERYSTQKEELFVRDDDELRIWNSIIEEPRGLN